MLWGWRGQPLLPDELAGLERIREAARRRVSARTCAALLSRAEVRATARRVDDLLERGALPAPLPDLAGHPLAADLNAASTRERRVPRGSPPFLSAS